MTTAQIDEFISNAIFAKNIKQANKKLEVIFTDIRCCDEGKEDFTRSGKHLMFKKLICTRECEDYCIILYYVDNIVTDYLIR